MAPVKLSQAPADRSLLGALLRDSLRSTANSSLQVDQGQKALLVAEVLACSGGLMRCRRFLPTNEEMRDFLEQCEQNARLSFTSSNRSHHLRSASEMLRAVEWRGVFQTPFFPPRVHAGVSAACAEAFDMALACGDARSLIAGAERARLRCFALRRSHPPASLSPRSPLALSSLPCADARSTLSSSIAADVAFEVLRRVPQNALALSSLSSLSSLTRLVFQARSRLALLCGGVQPHSLPLEPISVLAQRAGALIARRGERAVLLVELAAAARRALLYWQVLASPEHPRSLLVQQVLEMRRWLGLRTSNKESGDAPDASTAEASSSFNVLCANVGTSRDLTRVADVFTLADQAHATVVLLQETRLASLAQLPGLPRGWVAFVAGRKEGANKGGGVAVAVRQPMLGCALEKITHVDKGLEVVWARVRVNASLDQWFFCASVYVPPTNSRNAADKQAFHDQCDALIDKTRALVQQGELVVIGGDFNACLRSAARGDREILLQRLVCDGGLCVANAFPAPTAHTRSDTPRAQEDDDEAIAISLTRAPAPEQLDELSARSPVTHVQAGVGSRERAAPAPSQLDWLLVSPQFASCVRSFESVMRASSGHACIIMTAHIQSLEERFQLKKRPRLRLELLSRIHLSGRVSTRVTQAYEQEARVAENQASLDEAQQLPQTAPTLTTLLNTSITAEFASRNAAHMGVADAANVDEAYTLFHSVVQGAAVKLLTPLSQLAQSKHKNCPPIAAEKPTHTKLTAGASYVWWCDEVKRVHEEKKRAGREYEKQLSKNLRAKVTSGRELGAAELAATEELRKRLRAAERSFEREANEAKKSAFARFLRYLDDTLDVDRTYADSLWGCLRAIQRRKASPNGTDALIAVLPKDAQDFWKKIWSDDLCVRECEWVEELYAEASANENVRESLSWWIGSAARDEFLAITAPVTVQEVVACAKNLSARKAPGFDQLSNDVLRVLSPVALAEFVLVCNRAVAEQSLPAQWLRGSLKLLPKPNTSGTQAGDYRPICLLSCAFKLFEAVLMERLRVWCDYYDQHNHTPFLSPAQGGFREKRGTLDQVLNLLLIQQKYALLNSAQANAKRTRRIAAAAAAAQRNLSPAAGSSGVIAVFLDITKAFDSVPHGILLQKMLRKGVPVQFVRMCDLLLRKHYCEMDFSNGNFEVAAVVEGSDARIENRKGVIQGSISGPMFWNIFSNDLIERLESREALLVRSVTRHESAVSEGDANNSSGDVGVHTTTTSSTAAVSMPGAAAHDAERSSFWFADDASLVELSCANLQLQLDVCTEWAGPNRVMFAPKKSLALWLVKPSVLSAEHARVGDENLRLHGVVLDVVKSFCYLGIDILGGGDTTNTCSSSKLTKAETRVAQLQGMLRGDRALCPRLGLAVVRAKINSTLLYGCDILENNGRADIVQRQALRTVTAAYDRVHSFFLYSELGESRISTLAMCAFVAAAARFIASPTPIACCVAQLTIDVLDTVSASSPPPSTTPPQEQPPQLPLLAWQQRLRSCLQALCNDDENEMVDGERAQGAASGGRGGDSNGSVLVTAEMVEKFGMRVERAEMGADEKAWRNMLSALAGQAKREGKRGLCVRELLLTLARQRQDLAREFPTPTALTSRNYMLKKLSHMAKCVKALARTLGLLHEHRWWREQASLHRFPLARLAGPGEGQVYLCGFSVPHATTAFLFRTGSFNPADVVARHGGELACTLCGEAGGDVPLHLVGLCSGGENVKCREKLRELRARARELYGNANLVDWSEIVYGLVARVRGVSTAKLTRERVLAGCEILHEFYSLRRENRRNPQHGAVRAAAAAPRR